MFTGLIQDVGEIAESRPSGRGRRLRVRSRLGAEAAIGDSIAVDGACLTVVEADTATFAADVSTETLERTSLGAKRPGDRVNLEPALRLGDRLGGHLVTGHIDGTGRLTERRPDGDGLALTFSAPPELLRLVVTKGSISVDGISLTVNRVSTSGFDVMIVPHTLAETTLRDRRPGDVVNLETDLLGKYVARLLAQPRAATEGGISEEMLARNGFL